MPSLQASLRGVFGPKAENPVAAPKPPPKSLFGGGPLLRLIPASKPARSPRKLASLVQDEVIPRLLQAHGHEPGQAAALDPLLCDPAIPPGAAEAFLGLARAGSLRAMREAVASLEAAGAAPASLFRWLLAPTARSLVQMWHDDVLSYADVTSALGVLKQMARGMDAATPYNGDDNARAVSALIAPRPGEERTFGLYLMAEMFRWSGWRTSTQGPNLGERICETVHEDWYDLLCVHVARREGLEDIRLSVDEARSTSRNAEMCILVSGRLFEETPALIDAVGADAAVADAEGAFRFLEETVAHRAAA